MSEISQIKKRFLQFIDYKGLNQQEIFDKLGFSKWNFTGKSLNSELGGDKIREISLLFPEISLDWLVCGKDPMLRDTSGVDPPINQYEVIRLLQDRIEDQRSRIEDQRKIIGLLEEKVKTLQSNTSV